MTRKPSPLRHTPAIIISVLVFAALLSCSEAPVKRGPSAWERLKAYASEQAAWVHSMLPWTEPDLTGVWKGFVRLTAAAKDARYELVQNGELVAGHIAIAGDAYRYPVRGVFRDGILTASIDVSNELCDGSFQVSGEFHAPYLRLSGSGTLCGLESVPVKTDLRRTAFHFEPEQPVIPDARREQVIWIDGLPEHYPVAADFYPAITPVIDEKTGRIEGFRFEIPTAQDFPTVTRCERLAEPSEQCESEGGLVPDERPAWPLEKPSVLDWAVIDLDRIAASGPNVEKILSVRSDSYSTLDGGFGLQQLVGGEADNRVEVRLASGSPPEVLDGTLSTGRYFSKLLDGDFRPRIFSRVVDAGSKVRLAKGSIPLGSCNFKRRCRGEFAFRKELAGLDLSDHPNLMLAARVRTQVTKPYFQRPFIRQSGTETWELGNSFNPPGWQGEPYDVYSSASLSPLSHAEIRIDYPLVTFQMDDRTHIARIGLRIGIAQIVNSLHVAAPRFPSFAEADLQILADDCIAELRPLPVAARQTCAGVLDKPRLMSLRIPEKPDMPVNPPRDGVLDLSKDAWDMRGKARWSENDWLSIEIHVRGTPGREVSESHLIRMKDATVSIDKLLRFVATPRIVEAVYEGGEMRRDYKIEGVLITGDRVDLTLDPDTVAKVTPVSLPGPDLHVSPGTLMIRSPGTAILRFYHRKFTLMPAELALIVKDPAAPGSGAAGSLPDTAR